MIVLSSCVNGNGGVKQSFNTTPVNVVVSNSTGETTLSLGIYSFQTETYSQTGTISAQDIVVNNNTVSFVAKDLSYTTAGYDVIFKNVETTTTGSYSYDLHNGNFTATPFYNYPGLLGINSPYNPSASFVFPLILVGSYRLDSEYTVKTFQNNTFFTGRTQTSYNYMGSTGSASTKDVMYGLILNIKENTASIILYNAKFTDLPQETKKEQVNLENLSLECRDGNIMVKGKDVIPQVFEGGVPVPAQDFIFNSIEFRTSNNDLTEGYITFSIMDGAFNGTFNGIYADLTGNMNNN